MATGRAVDLDQIAGVAIMKIDHRTVVEAVDMETDQEVILAATVSR